MLFVKRGKKANNGRITCPKCGKEFNVTVEKPAFFDFKNHYDGLVLKYSNSFNFKYFECQKCKCKFKF